MKCVLTRRTAGTYYLLTKGKPVLACLAPTDIYDVYAKPGDLVNIQVCEHTAHIAWGIELKPLESQEIIIDVRAVGKPKPVGTE